MRIYSLLVTLAFLAAPVWAIELVELKNGRVIEADAVKLDGKKLLLSLHTGNPDQFVRYAIPIEKIVPEFVYYAWAGQLQPGDSNGRKKLADWARSQGLFRHAWRAYEQAGVSDQALKDKLHEEEATWTFDDAWKRFQDGDVQTARARAERVLDLFADTKEVGRAKELLKMVAEREQFLSEQKKQEEIAKRARKQKKTVDKHLERMAKADRQVLRARLRYTHSAKRRLTWAAYTYRKAALAFSEILAVAEVDELRLTLRALIADLEDRLVRTFLKLGDLRYLTGDTPGALDAAHEVLALRPDHKAATDLREKVLSRGTARVLSEPVSYRYPSYLYRHGLLLRRGSRHFGHGVHVHSSRFHRYGFGLYPLYCR